MRAATPSLQEPQSQPLLILGGPGWWLDARLGLASDNKGRFLIVALHPRPRERVLSSPGLSATLHHLEPRTWLLPHPSPEETSDAESVRPPLAQVQSLRATPQACQSPVSLLPSECRQSLSGDYAPKPSRQLGFDNQQASRPPPPPPLQSSQPEGLCGRRAAAG